MATLSLNGSTFLTRSVLRARGWMPKMIERLLDTPDWWARDPYGHGSLTPLWDLARVEAVESTEAFRTAQQASLTRRGRAAIEMLKSLGPREVKDVMRWAGREWGMVQRTEQTTETKGHETP
ncbi:MAG: hypothetical protein ACYC4U_10335 [Pirellulaceae bacterium]